MKAVTLGRGQRPEVTFMLLEELAYKGTWANSKRLSRIRLGLYKGCTVMIGRLAAKVWL